MRRVVYGPVGLFMFTGTAVAQQGGGSAPETCATLFAQLLTFIRGNLELLVPTVIIIMALAGTLLYVTGIFKTLANSILGSVFAGMGLVILFYSVAWLLSQFAPLNFLGGC